MGSSKTKRLLYVGASPTGMDRVDVGQLGEIIRHELGAASADIEVNAHVACTWRGFQKLLLEHDPHFLHVGCHGAGGAFYFQKDDSSAHSIRGDRFVRELESCRSLQWVILNACSSGPTAATLCSTYQRPVVGMSEDITSASCIAYTRDFYLNFGRRGDLEASHRSGLRGIEGSCEDEGVDSEAHIPRLYLPQVEASASAPKKPAASAQARPVASQQSGLAALLHDLLEKHLVQHPDLAAALAKKLKAPPNPDALAATVIGLDVVTILRALTQTVRTAGSLRAPAQGFAQLILPAVVNWSEDTRARIAVAEDGPTILTLPFLNRPICEIAVAGLQGRPADLSSEGGSKAALTTLAGMHLPLRNQQQAMRLLIAEAILRRADIPFAHLRSKPEMLIKQARDVMQFNRDERAPADRYHMYLVFSSAEVGAVGAVHDELPELWLIEGTGDEDDLRITLYLRELFEWQST